MLDHNDRLLNFNPNFFILIISMIISPAFIGIYIFDTSLQGLFSLIIGIQSLDYFIAEIVFI